MTINCRPRFNSALFGVSVVAIVLIVFALNQFSFNTSLLQHNLDKLPSKFAANMKHWLSRNSYRSQWESIHCNQDKNQTKKNIFDQWVKKLSKTLGVRNGQSLFDTNIGCLRWLKQFRSQFPDLDLAGFDQDDDTVDYAERFFNDTRRKFVKRLSRARNNSFDHAINIAGLQTKRADLQCSEAKAILKTLKPGGIFYIGHNLEEICKDKICEKCLADSKNIGFTILDKCFWPKVCLRSEYDVHYVLERNFFGSAEDFSECQTGVFVRKKPGGKGHTNKTLPALRPSDIYYQC